MTGSCGSRIGKLKTYYMILTLPMILALSSLADQRTSSVPPELVRALSLTEGQEAQLKRETLSDDTLTRLRLSASQQAALSAIKALLPRWRFASAVIMQGRFKRQLGRGRICATTRVLRNGFKLRLA